MMNQKKPIPVKYFYYGMIACVLFIGAVFFFVFKKEAREDKLLAEKGVEGEAWVLNLSSSKVSRKSSPIYTMEVAFFADTTAKPIVKDTVKATPKNGDELVKSIAALTKDVSKPLGDYKTIKLPITLADYNKYNINDKVKIKYVKDDPSIARLIRNL